MSRIVVSWCALYDLIRFESLFDGIVWFILKSPAIRMSSTAWLNA